MSSKAPEFDVVIVGAGIAGSLVADKLGRAGKKVLMLEAGPPIPDSREEYMSKFLGTNLKTPNAPYPPPTGDPSGQSAPRAAVPDLFDWKNHETSYLIQTGPVAFTTGYERVAGGTTTHWMGTCLRFSATDFKCKSTYGVGRDWPLSYDDLSPWYDQAEKAIGVSAKITSPADDPGSVQNQDVLTDALGISYTDGYDYPMNRIKPTILDQLLAKKLNGLRVEGMDDNPVVVTSTPAGRNSEAYDGRPACKGNSNCVPICPISAKYDGTVTLNKALDSGNVTIWYQCVVDKLIIGDDDRIESVHYIKYKTGTGGKTEDGTVRGQVVVLAAHAIESPKILLNSKTKKFPDGAANSSGQVGRNLMDQPSHLAYGRLPVPVWPWRAPNATSGVETLRDGKFRSKHASFRVEIGNKGWLWATNDPYTTTQDYIQGTNVGHLNPGGKKLFGKALRDTLRNKLSCEFRILFETEQLPDPKNRVTLSDTYTDKLGIPRPEVYYSIDDYTARAFVKARETAAEWFDVLEVEDSIQNPYSQDKSVAGYFEYKGIPFVALGVGHIMGTHLMGDDKKDSVLNKQQRSWDHDNLFMVGGGVFPASGCANPTLTIAALSLWVAEHILQDLGE